MNIKNRIKKIENKIIGNKFDFCTCFDNHFEKMLDKVYDDVPYDERSALLPDGEFCDKCQKPVSVPTQNFNKAVELAYG